MSEQNGPLEYVFNGTIQEETNDTSQPKVLTYYVTNTKRKQISVKKVWQGDLGDLNPTSLTGKLTQEATNQATVHFDANDGISDLYDVVAPVTVAPGTILKFQISKGTNVVHDGFDSFKEEKSTKTYTVQVPTQVAGANAHFKPLVSDGTGTYEVTILERSDQIPFTLNGEGWQDSWTVFENPSPEELTAANAAEKPYFVEYSGATYSYQVQEDVVTDGTGKNITKWFKVSYEQPDGTNGYTGTITNEKQELPTLKIYKNGIYYENSVPKNQAMSGVSFLLQRQSEDTWVNVGADEYGGGGNPRPTDAEGYATFTELEPGTYKLTEQSTSANAGYIIRGPWIVTVSEGAITMKMEGATDNETPTSSEVGGTYEYQIDNTQAYDLPSAGGPGTYLFTISGVAMLFTALLLWIKPNRKEAWTEE